MLSDAGVSQAAMRRILSELTGIRLGERLTAALPRDLIALAYCFGGEAMDWMIETGSLTPT